MLSDTEKTCIATANAVSAAEIKISSFQCQLSNHFKPVKMKGLRDTFPSPVEWAWDQWLQNVKRKGLMDYSICRKTVWKTLQRGREVSPSSQP